MVCSSYNKKYSVIRLILYTYTAKQMISRNYTLDCVYTIKLNQPKGLCKDATHKYSVMKNSCMLLHHSKPILLIIYSPRHKSQKMNCKSGCEKGNICTTIQIYSNFATTISFSQEKNHLFNFGSSCLALFGFFLNFWSFVSTTSSSLLL